MSTAPVPEARPLRVYLSSTMNDLREHRAAVLARIRKMGTDRFVVISQEDYIAESQIPLEKCLADVRGCEVYLGLFAFRYGYIPPNNNPAGLSITELEYREAVARNLEIIVLVADAEGAHIPAAHIDENRTRINQFRAALLRDHTVASFKGREEAAGEAQLALGKAAERLRGGWHSPVGPGPAPASGRSPRPWRALALALLAAVLALAAWLAWGWFTTQTLPVTRWHGTEDARRAGLSPDDLRPLEGPLSDPRNLVLSGTARAEIDALRRKNNWQSEGGDVAVYLSNRCCYPDGVREISWPGEWQVRAFAYQMEERREGRTLLKQVHEGRDRVTFTGNEPGRHHPRWLVLFLFPLDGTTAQQVNWNSHRIVVK